MRGTWQRVVPIAMTGTLAAKTSKRPQRAPIAFAYSSYRCRLAYPAPPAHFMLLAGSPPVPVEDRAVEFLVEIAVNLPPDFDPQKAKALREAEAARGVELYDAGIIRRTWRIPGRRAAVAIWAAADATALHDALVSLPLFPWLDIRVTPLARHYLEDLIEKRHAAASGPAPPASEKR